MAMYGRVQPDKLGRPNGIWFSAHAAQVIGGGLWTLSADDGGYLVLRHAEDGTYRIGKSRFVSCGALLDQFNTEGELTNEPFPIRRRRDGVFELAITSPDPQLGGRSNSQRQTAMPMQYTPGGLPERQVYSQDDLVRLYALLTVALGEPVTEASFDDPHPLLEKLPSLAAIRGRSALGRVAGPSPRALLNPTCCHAAQRHTKKTPLASHHALPDPDAARSVGVTAIPRPQHAPAGHRR